jgi:hypothetical protein
MSTKAINLLSNFYVFKVLLDEFHHRFDKHCETGFMKCQQRDVYTAYIKSYNKFYNEREPYRHLKKFAKRLKRPLWLTYLINLVKKINI